MRNVLKEAEELIYGERMEMYGPAGESFGKIAAIASSLLNKEMLPEEIMVVQVVTKLVRSSYSPAELDHLVDACGYLALLANQLQEVSVVSPRVVKKRLEEL